MYYPATSVNSTERNFHLKYFGLFFLKWDDFYVFRILICSITFNGRFLFSFHFLSPAYLIAAIVFSSTRPTGQILRAREGTFLPWANTGLTPTIRLVHFPQVKLVFIHLLPNPGHEGPTFSVLKLAKTQSGLGLSTHRWRILLPLRTELHLRLFGS